MKGGVKVFRKEDLKPTQEAVERLARDLLADLERLERPREPQLVANARTPNAVAKRLEELRDRGAR